MSGGTEYAEALVRAEAKIARLESALASRHGGEPIALLAELDAERERRTAAERRAEALAEALAAERWERAWNATMRTLSIGPTERTIARRKRDWWHRAARRARSASDRVERARAALSSGGPDATR